MQSELRRAGATICVCILIGGVVTGCAGNKTGNTVPTRAPATTAYKNASALATNLASLGSVSGPIHGTITVGSNEHTLSGTVSLTRGASQVSLLESGQDQVIADEIVLGSHRYTSPDDKIWIDRGSKADSTGLAAALAGADTTQDAGVGTVDGVKAHKILTTPDKMDIAPALGIDTWTYDNESTTLRVWANDAGKPVGFGASMSWRVTLGGVQQEVATELDVMFTYTSPVQIEAPTSPWKWVEDKPAGIAFALPTAWKRSPVNDALGVTTYLDPASADAVAYNDGLVGNLSLADATKKIGDQRKDTPSGTQIIEVGAEDASWMTYHRTKQKDYQVVAIAVHETIVYQIFLLGDPAKESALDSLARQVFATVEFTR